MATAPAAKKPVHRARAWGLAPRSPGMPTPSGAATPRGAVGWAFGSGRDVPASEAGASPRCGPRPLGTSVVPRVSSAGCGPFLQHPPHQTQSSGSPAALPALPAGAALCPWGPPAGRVSASAGGEELQGDRAADPGHPLPPGRLRVSEQHRRLEPGLCRPHHHRLGFPQCCQDLQPDFPRKNSCLPLPSVSATGRPYPRSPRPSGVPAPPLREVVQRQDSEADWPPEISRVGEGGFRSRLPDHSDSPSVPRPSLPSAAAHAVRAQRAAQSGWAGRGLSSPRHPYSPPPPRPAPGCPPCPCRWPW